MIINGKGVADQDDGLGCMRGMVFMFPVMVVVAGLIIWMCV